MIWLLIGIAIGAVAKTLLPWPWADDRVRAAWNWAWSKVS